MSSVSTPHPLAGAFAGQTVLVPGDVSVVLEEKLLLFDQAFDAPCTFQLAGGHAAVYSCRSPAKSTPNEDAAALIPLGEKLGVLVVADGVGGHAGGEQAARVTIETILNHVSGGQDDQSDGESLRSVILNGIEAANEAVQRLANGSATTLAIAEIQDAFIRTYHVGDSVILLTGQRGKLKLQTIAHSPVGYAVESGMIDEKDAIHHEDRHVISNVIGASDMRIEIGPAIEMAPRDTLLLASDGLLDNLLPSEIVHLIRTGRLDAAIDRLADKALGRMRNPSGNAPSKPDDLTIIAFRLG